MQLLKREGFLRLWRGAPAVFTGCVPAHAAYFSSYEWTKEAFGANKEGHHPVAAAGSGIVATMLHDSLITPMDVVKQRLQLGYYRGVAHCLQTITREEGLRSLFRSYPTTLVMNIPYAAVTVSTNESLKKILTPEGQEANLLTFLLAGAGAGAVAAAATCPLDVIKTRLQTATLPERACQNLEEGGGGGVLSPAGAGGPTTAATATATGSSNGSSAAAAGKRHFSTFSSLSSAYLTGGWRRLVSTTTTATAAAAAAGAAQQKRSASPPPPPRITALDIARQLWKEGGSKAFFKGAHARMAAHAPSVAVSWAVYEAAKAFLVERGIAGNMSGNGSGSGAGEMH